MDYSIKRLTTGNGEAPPKTPKREVPIDAQEQPVDPASTEQVK